MTKAILAAALSAAILTGCMSDREYQLRKRQLEAQAAHPPAYELFTVNGPFTTVSMTVTRLNSVMKLWRSGLAPLKKCVNFPCCML